MDTTTTENKVYNLEPRLLDFSVQVIKLVEQLPNTKTGCHVSGQLIRSGTSPVANYGEALGAGSRKDFIHKIRICLKELRETHIWLKIISKTIQIKDADKLKCLLDECNQLISIFVASIKTAEKKYRLAKDEK